MSYSVGISLKLVIIDKEGRVLVDAPGTVHSLPEVVIPPCTRIAHSATMAASEKWGINLFVILYTRYTSSENLVVVCRLQDINDVPPHGLKWCDASQTLLENLDRSVLDTALDEFELYNSGAKPSSFGKYGSLDELRAWYAPCLATLGLRETGLQQWNGDPWFALCRLRVEPVAEVMPKTPKAFWFKAVGEPNTREFAVTLALAQECSHWIPRIVATKPNCNGWLMEEVSGPELYDEGDELQWKITATTLAKIQQRFLGQDGRLIELGCCDWRVPRVLEYLSLLFEDAEEVMQRQPSEPPRILHRSELRKLKIRCQDLCHRVEDLDVPYTLIHGDFSPHNVIVSDDGPILIDWAEAYLGFPFISWEYFWSRMVKERPELSEWRARIIHSYTDPIWASLLGTDRVRKGLDLSPAMAVLVYAMYGIDKSEQRQDRRRDPVKRSLMRRLQHELGILEPVGAL